jgi:hypothetical protein
MKDGGLKNVPSFMSALPPGQRRIWTWNIGLEAQKHAMPLNRERRRRMGPSSIMLAVPASPDVLPSGP